MQKTIKKQENKIAKILGSLKGFSRPHNDGQTLTVTDYYGDLEHKQIKKLLKLGTVTIQPLGKKIRLIIISF